MIGPSIPHLTRHRTTIPRYTNVWLGHPYQKHTLPASLAACPESKFVWDRDAVFLSHHCVVWWKYAWDGSLNIINPCSVHVTCACYSLFIIAIHKTTICHKHFPDITKIQFCQLAHIVSPVNHGLDHYNSQWLKPFRPQGSDFQHYSSRWCKYTITPLKWTGPLHHYPGMVSYITAAGVGGVNHYTLEEWIEPLDTSACSLKPLHVPLTGGGHAAGTNRREIINPARSPSPSMSEHKMGFHQLMQEFSPARS